MVAFPKKVRDAWDNHEGPGVLATVSKDGIPNIIYVSCASLYGDDRVVVADNYFDKTRKNIQAGSKAAFLFLDKQGKSYQVKGTLEYHKEGKLFEQMKAENPPEHPGHAAAVLCVEEAYSGSEKLC